MESRSEVSAGSAESLNGWRPWLKNALEIIRDEHKKNVVKNFKKGMDMNMIKKFLERIDEIYPSPISPAVTDDCTVLKIYSKLMSQDEAGIAINLTAEPESAGSLAKRIGKSVEEVAPVLEKLANNGVVFMVFKEEPLYSLIVFAPGTLEFTVKEGIMDKEMAVLMNDFIKEMETEVWPKLPKGALRIVPVQESIKAQSKRLAYEEVERYIDEATDVASADCMCRISSKLLGKGCNHPVEGMCLWLGPFADYYERTGRGKRITKEEAKAILHKAEEAGLVHQMMLMQEGSPYICNCCSCCCLGSLSVRKNFRGPDIALRTNYISQISKENCVGCGTCVDYCQFNAIQLEEDAAVVNEKECMGCGVCTIHCTYDAIEMIPRADTVHPPKDIAEFAQEVNEYIKTLGKDN
jgi:Pyruvate/2-oxoacid:ferredoxin oxidoreductase delta subunit